LNEKKVILALTTLVLAAATLPAQSFSTSSNLAVYGEDTDGGSFRTAPAVQGQSATMAPFSRIAIGGGFSTLGPGIQITTNLADHFNLRATGNGFHYTTNFTTSGFNADAKLNMVSAGLAADIYPFHLGFRISPGLMVLNNNRISASSFAEGGTSFTFNDVTYYSANLNSATGATPLSAYGVLGLNSTKPAFTLAAGWGNTIPRNGGHWSFPVEAGVAFIGQPSVNVTLSGWACADQAQTECTNVQDPSNQVAQQIQTNLAAQITKWKNDLNPLKTYPIASFGVAYSFGIRAGVM
jgi:hypothetical protein